MKNLSTNGVKWLKIVHLIVLVLMLGGIICSTILRVSLRLTAYDEVLVTYKVLQGISDYVVRYGAQGLLLTGLAYSLFTNWGFFKHTWVAVKWAIFMAQTIFGIVFIDPWMVRNLALLESEGTSALTNPLFLNNHAPPAWISAAVRFAFLLLADDLDQIPARIVEHRHGDLAHFGRLLDKAYSQ